MRTTPRKLPLTGLVALAAGRVASANLSPKPAVIGADGVARITDALAAYCLYDILGILKTENMYGHTGGKAECRCCCVYCLEIERKDL